MDRDEIEVLLGQVALRDRKAFGQLYARTSAKLFGVCLRVLGKRAAAEDALQDVFIKIWRNADRYQANGLSPMTWLITIARNTSIDYLRAGKKPTKDIDDPAVVLVATGPTPEQVAVAHDEARRLSACLDALPEDRGAAVRGAYLDGASYAEMATHFDVPLNTMRTWLRRGLASLRECMAQ